MVELLIGYYENADPTLLDVKKLLKHAKDRKFEELVKKLDGSDMVLKTYSMKQLNIYYFWWLKGLEAERKKWKLPRTCRRQAKMEAEGPWGGHVKQEEVDAHG